MLAQDFFRLARVFEPDPCVLSGSLSNPSVSPLQLALIEIPYMSVSLLP